MFIFLAPNIVKKNMTVSFDINKLFLQVNGVTLIDGKWKDKINAEETYWTIEEGSLDNYKGKYLHLNV